MSNAYEFLYQEDLYKATDATLILIDQPWATISEADKVLLSKILGSVKISLEEVSILHADKISLQEVAQYNPIRIIAFGTSIAESEGTYKNQKQGNTAFITSEALSALDDVKKKNLWGALKQMFA
jgi:DNA polymerase III psi subunit